MNTHLFLSTTNAFADAFWLSDLFGKGIFVALVLLSIWSWTLLWQKTVEILSAKKEAKLFEKHIQANKAALLALESPQEKPANPFLEVYLQAKKISLELLHKNHSIAQDASYLSSNDIDAICTHVYTAASKQMLHLEKNLYQLATISSLAPYIGLLGTVWGILMTFGQLQTQSSGGMHQAVLGGLSLALVTTVLGLLDAIPALLGYSYLKNHLKSFTTDMEGFSSELVTAIEMQYRK